MNKDLTVILADGDFPKAAQPLKLLHDAARIVCCDGAAVALLQYGLEPDLIVGDLDSLPEKMKRLYADRLIHFSEQENNDLTKTFRYCRSRGWNELVILGATGKREDHTLGNLSLLADYAEELPGMELVTDYGVFSVAVESSSFTSTPGQQISIFALDSGCCVSSEGLKFPMKKLKLRSWWQATLNEALGNTFSLEFESGNRILVFRSFN